MRVLLLAGLALAALCVLQPVVEELYLSHNSSPPDVGFDSSGTDNRGRPVLQSSIRELGEQWLSAIVEDRGGGLAHQARVREISGSVIFEGTAWLKPAEETPFYDPAWDEFQAVSGLAASSFDHIDVELVHDRMRVSGVLRVDALEAVFLVTGVLLPDGRRFLGLNLIASMVDETGSEIAPEAGGNSRDQLEQQIDRRDRALSEWSAKELDGAWTTWWDTVLSRAGAVSWRRNHATKIGGQYFFHAIARVNNAGSDLAMEGWERLKPWFAHDSFTERGVLAGQDVISSWQRTENPGAWKGEVRISVVRQRVDWIVLDVFVVLSLGEW